MKLLDKFLKILKTDRNTFFTYILTLLTAYIVIDRIIELLFLFFTGMSVNYWGPITYTIAMACPVFAFLFSFSSKFMKSDETKISFFYVYCICLYIIGISMITQWLNHLAWLSILSLPNYEIIVTEFSDLIKTALTAFAIYIPITTFYKLITWLSFKINNPIFPNDFRDSIVDYTGIDISNPSMTTGPYSFELTFCMDKETGKPAKIVENKRFDSTVIIGPSGTGKTSLLLEPMIARDLEKKYFFREVAKEMGYTALKTGLATLNCPYDNEYINKYFRLDMLTPVEGKEKIYKAYMNKMIYYSGEDGLITYRNLGITCVSPDIEHIDRIAEVAKSFNLPVNIVDPLNPNSIGLNPFTINNPALCGLIISIIIKGLYHASNVTAELAYMEDMALQAIQNICILLKIIYPQMHDGEIATLQDLLHCLNNFDYVQEMCEVAKQDEEFRKTYELQFAYFEQNFYRGSDGRDNMKRFIHFASSQLDILLRSGQVRDIICNRHTNINFADILANGEVVYLCTRQPEIGGAASKGFARFFIFLMMIATEGRPGNEKSKIPHFLYMDDFEEYGTDAFSDMLIFYRKFKVGAILTLPTLSELGGVSTAFSQKILANSSTKISLGNSTPEDYAWWELEFGERREWTKSNNYDGEKETEYSSNQGNVQWEWKNTLKKAKQQGLKFKTILYKTKDLKGKNLVGFGNVDFLETKYKEPHKTKIYSFDKYVNNVFTKDIKEEDLKPKFNPKKINFDNDDPIQTDTTDSSYFFNNSDAISFNLNKKKKPDEE